jgi:hypothetical protein
MPIGSAYGSLRTWYSQVDWADLETARCDPQSLDAGCWNWAPLDAFIALSTQDAGVSSIHYVIGNYPHWASNTPPDGGTIAPVVPYDVGDAGPVCSAMPAGFLANAGLLPGDCQFQEFAFALAMHTCAGCVADQGPWAGPLSIRSFSPGNEINDPTFVSPKCDTGSTVGCANVARMAADLRRIVKAVDPTVIVGTPSTTNPTAMAAYLSSGGDGGPGLAADVLIYHIYGETPDAGNDVTVRAGMPEDDWAGRIQAYTALQANPAYQMQSKPTWVDEGGWGQNFQTNLSGQACAASECGCAASPIAPCMNAGSIENQTPFGNTTAPAPGFLVRAYLTMIDNQVDRFYWYAAGADEWGSMADYSGAVFQPTATRHAWASMVRWLVGASLGTIRPGTGTQLTVQIAAKDAAQPSGCGDAEAGPGYQAEIAWDTLSTTSTLACGSFGHFCTLFEGDGGIPYAAGAQRACPDGGTVTLGPNPILLEP